MNVVVFATIFGACVWCIVIAFIVIKALDALGDARPIRAIALALVAITLFALPFAFASTGTPFGPVERIEGVRR